MTDQEIENAVRAAGGQWDGDVWRFEDADLHPFVRSILASMATSPASEALTPQQREDILVKAGAICDGGMSHDDFGLEIIDQVERHYGICAHGAGSISKS